MPYAGKESAMSYGPNYDFATAIAKAEAKLAARPEDRALKIVVARLRRMAAAAPAERAARREAELAARQGSSLRVITPQVDSPEDAAAVAAIRSEVEARRPAKELIPVAGEEPAFAVCQGGGERVLRSGRGL